ncbi:zinc ribbon domain-containing protein [Metallosphaera hakonensis]|uniref:Zinc-ribbon domain-containing protein n=1 Tax=Metallosphaera hakonensis JCM 8857 = DSM 7519 TaxID=1293036 RepID=A0A2U9ISR2_9CREN|nr:zinc ribbon domain-containing protein [Metallosphaera hakonensis]AWR98982.1 zinc-ribbon domain-containing protein [Metallosphaera hakonensis JCM 8857 = DSM 7519]
MKKCPRCGYENPDTVQLCERCRYPLSTATQSYMPPTPMKCPRCGYENQGNAATCERCRYPLRIGTFELEEERVEQSPEPFLRFRDGALYLVIGVLFLFLSIPPVNQILQDVLSLISVVFLGLSTGSYSVGFRLMGKELRSQSILSLLLLPGFLFLVSGIGVVNVNVTKLNISELSKNPLAVGLIDLGFILFLIGGIALSMGMYKLGNMLGRSPIKIASILTLIGIVAFFVIPELEFLLIGGQFLIYLEFRNLAIKKGDDHQ